MATPLDESGCAEHSNKYLSASEVMQRLGKSQMTIWRWLRDPKMNFPKPYRFQRQRAWSLCELLAWERSTKEENAHGRVG